MTFKWDNAHVPTHMPSAYATFHGVECFLNHSDRRQIHCQVPNRPVQAMLLAPSSRKNDRLSQRGRCCPVLYRASEGIRWLQKRPRAMTRSDWLRRDFMRHSLFSGIACTRASAAIVSHLFTRLIQKQMPHPLPAYRRCCHITVISIMLLLSRPPVGISDINHAYSRSTT